MRPQSVIGDQRGRGLCRMIAAWTLAVAMLLSLSGLAAADDRDPDAQTPTISVADMRGLIGRRAPLLIVDVRAPSEFAVSHIVRAINIDPALPYADFIARFGAAAAGKAVVLYCTAQTRSAEYALGVEDALLKRGAASVHVLAGGLIGWHNEEAPLVAAGGMTRLIHPFLPELVPRLRRPSLARMPVAP